MKDIPLFFDSSLPKTDRAIFDRISFSWIIFLFGAFVLAVSGVFTTETVGILSSFTVFGTVGLLWHLRPSKELSLVGALIIVFVLLVSYPSFPSVFSGRDQGSYAEAAIRLAHDHSLVSRTPSASEDFFRIYGEGKALNIPGFFYTKDGGIATQFPLGVIVWFGASISLFEIVGLSLANAFTLFFSLLAIFFFLRRFLSFPFAASSVAVAALSFPFIWISDIALSENLALPLFLLVSFHLVSFLKKPEALSWWLTISSAIFLFLTRIEGFFIFAVVFLLALAHQKSRLYLKTHIFSAVFPTLVASGIFFCMSLFSNLPFYRTLGKTLFESFISSGEASPSSSSIFSPLLRNLEIFWTYGMISVFALAILGVLFLFSKRQFIRLTPFFLALPTCAYLISPNISPDHPWMLRRFAFSIWPVALLLAVFAMAHFQKVFHEKYPGKSLFRPVLFSILFSSFLILPALPATVPILFFSENKDLLEDVETLSKDFSSQDLVLVDRMASGDPYSMIADPMSTLFGKNAIYFFNPDDLNRLDVSRFKNIYLIVRNGDETMYQSAFGTRFALKPVRSYTLHASILSRETDPQRLPVKKEDAVSGNVFLIVPQ